MAESSEENLELFPEQVTAPLAGVDVKKSNSSKFALPPLGLPSLIEGRTTRKAGMHWEEDESGSAELLPPPEYLSSSTLPKQERGARRSRRQYRGAAQNSRTKPWQVVGLTILMMIGSTSLAARTPADMSLGWNTSAKRAAGALEAGRLGEARNFIDEAKEVMPDHVLPFLLESRLGLAEQDLDLARLSAKAGLVKSLDWHSDLVIARVLARTGDKQGAADAALQSFVKGASIGYLPEIAEAQMSIGRGAEAKRVVDYGRQQGNVREEGFERQKGPKRP